MADLEDGVRSQFILNNVPDLFGKSHAFVLKWFKTAWLDFCQDEENHFVVAEAEANKQVLNYLDANGRQCMADSNDIRASTWEYLTRQFSEMTNEDKVCCVFQHWFRLSRCRAEYLGFADTRTEAEGPVTAFVCIACGLVHKKRELAHDLTRRCARCQKVVYCSEECEQLDYQKHKLTCKLANC